MTGQWEGVRCSCGRAVHHGGRVAVAIAAMFPIGFILAIFAFLGK